MTQPETALVFGATGFFGGHIADRLEAVGIAVSRLGRQTGPDLRDADAVRDIVASERPDLIVAAAGMASPRTALEDPAGCFALNVGGMLNLLEAVRTESPSTHVIALSSAAVYAGEPPFKEDSPTVGNEPYSASKLAMEMICHQYGCEGLKVTVIRSFNLIGPGEPAVQISSELVRAAVRADSGAQVKVEVADPEISRDFTDAGDAAEAIRRIAETGATGIFNLCSGSEVTLAQLGEVVSGVTGVEVRLISEGRVNPTGQSRSFGSPDRLRQVTGWSSEATLEESVRRLSDS